MQENRETAVTLWNFPVLTAELYIFLSDSNEVD